MKKLTKSEKEGRQLSSDTELPIVLVHGTMGKSEDWSRVVEQLSKSRSVIRPDYAERIAGRNPAKALAIKDLADEVVVAVKAEGKQRFDLVGSFPRGGSCHLHRGRVSGTGPFPCTRIRLQPWKRSAAESPIQTLASFSEQ